jgi:hypothetical protein
MSEHNRASPLKIGLLIVAISYFLFTLHALFTLEWVGEWDRIASGALRLPIMLEDVSAFVGVIFRFLGSIIALSSVVFYFSREVPPTQKIYRILKWVLSFEAIYWITLLPTAGVEVYFVIAGLSSISILDLLNNLAWTVIPSIIEAIVPPIVLLILTLKLSRGKPQNKAIKWALITGTTYILVFWLLNTSSWVLEVSNKGTQYLTNYPQNMISYIVTLAGLLALTIYSGYFAWKSRKVQSLQELNLRTAGAIISALGMYFLWNYLTWIFFGGNYVWSNWYAWFLGHNLDLWMLSLPLAGLPLIFYTKHKTGNNS